MKVKNLSDVITSFDFDNLSDKQLKNLGVYMSENHILGNQLGITSEVNTLKDDNSVEFKLRYSWIESTDPGLKKKYGSVNDLDLKGLGGYIAGALKIINDTKR
jgi:hypothetical protein